MANPNGSYKRGGRGNALYVTMAVAFIVILAITAMALFFKVSDITVEGAERYTDRQIIDASGVEIDNSIFFLSSGGAEVDIKAELPYVDSVKVERRLPGSVIIHVTESRPAAYITSDASVWVIDVKGRILEETTLSHAQGAEIRGADADSPELGKNLSFGSGESVRLRALTDMLSALDGDNKLDKTAWLDISNLSAITFEYYGYKVNFGTTAGLETKLKCLNDFLADYQDEGHGQELVYNENDGGLYYRP